MDVSFVPTGKRLSCLYGHITQAKLRNDPTETVAIKAFNAHLCTRRVTAGGHAVAEDADVELAVLRKAAQNPHANLLAMHPAMGLLKESPSSVQQAVTSGRKLYAVMPWCDGGDLMAHLEAHGACTNAVAKRYFQAIASALAHLHRLGFCHRDVSLENIMLATDAAYPHGLRPMLADYGAAATMGVHRVEGVRPGKVGYVAPEIYTRQGGGYDGECADVYSLGVVLFCMLAGCMPYERPSAADPCFAFVASGQLGHLITSWGLGTAFGGGAMDLVTRMMSVDPSRRPTLAEVLAHPWVGLADADPDAGKSRCHVHGDGTPPRPASPLSTAVAATTSAGQGGGCAAAGTPARAATATAPVTTPTADGTVHRGGAQQGDGTQVDSDGDIVFDDSDVDTCDMEID